MEAINNNHEEKNFLIFPIITDIKKSVESNFLKVFYLVEKYIIE